ncbi:MAG: DUF177 domain-containing protein [Clostridia bacterium]|jgi:uncharacterized protein|nr:DUF177 domain-containing protein [Clostridia bacterium]
MFVDISEIMMIKDGNVSFDFSENFDAKDFMPDVNKFLSPVSVEGTVTNIKGDFHLKGNGKTVVEMSCSRCLKPVNVNIEFELDEIFSNKSKEEEVETFTGNTIELSSVVKKCILLNLPMKVLCDEDCKGLCPVCGKDLNEGDCECDTTYINPKFESLRSLFKVDEEV